MIYNLLCENKLSTSTTNNLNENENENELNGMESVTIHWSQKCWPFFFFSSFCRSCEIWLAQSIVICIDMYVIPSRSSHIPWFICLFVYFILVHCDVWVFSFYSFQHTYANNISRPSSDWCLFQLSSIACLFIVCIWMHTAISAMYIHICYMYHVPKYIIDKIK